jgi:hypothetical protein
MSTGEIQVPADQAVVIDDTSLKDALPPVTVNLDDEKGKDKGTPAPKILEPDEGIAKLQAQLKGEEAARLDAQRRAAAAEQDAATARTAEAAARTETAENRLHLTTIAIANLTQTLDTQQSSYETALANGDHATVAKLNRDMAVNAAKLANLEEGKLRLEQAPKVQARQAPPRQAPADPVEAFIATLDPRSTRSHDWIRSHPELVQTPRKLSAAHDLAIADGLTPNTDEYFRSVEQTLRIAPMIDPGHDPDPPPQRRAPQAAPVSRSTNGTQTGKNARTVTLSAEERNVAHFSFPDLSPADAEREYALGKLEIHRGKPN